MRIHYAIILLTCLMFCACADNRETVKNSTEESDLGPSVPAPVKAWPWVYLRPKSLQQIRFPSNDPATVCR